MSGSASGGNAASTTVAVPPAVAEGLVADDAATYVVRRRDPAAALGIGVAVLGVASDAVSLTLSRDAIADLLRRWVGWSAGRGEPSELTLRVAGPVEVDLRLSTTGNSDELLAVAAEVVELLRARAAGGSEHG